MKKIFSNQIGEQIWEKKYRFNNESYEEWLDRISNYNPKLKQCIIDKKFLFGGRILANLHTGQGSLSNCYSSGFVKDTLEDILQINTNLALTYKAQGGQGLSLSKIRPKGSKVGKFFTSDGIIPWAEMYNNTTQTIIQGAGRRGALLISLDITHPEAANFITLKGDLTKMQNTNVSVEIDDTFMTIVYEYYTDVNPNIILHKQFNYANEIYDYDLNVIELYKLLCKQACKTAEPGIIFTDMFRNYNLMEFDEDYQIETCNPCGEQPLPANGACLLGAINVSAYVKNAFTKDVYFDYQQFVQDIPIYYEELDNLIDIGMPFHALSEQRQQAENYRNIGLGTMGWADLFAKFMVIYGSKEAIVLATRIHSILTGMTFYTNCKLGEQKGSFTKFKTAETYKKSSFYETLSDFFILNVSKAYPNNYLPKDYLDVITNFKNLRNAAMLTLAPTGSIATMLNISNGIEPIYALQYTRRTVAIDGQDTVYTINSGIYEEYLQTVKEIDCLPSYFVEAKDVPWNQRIELQGRLQEWIDSGISSTINLPQGTTPEEIEKLFLYAWLNALKGITIYVDQSRENILSTDLNTEKQEFSGGILKRPKELNAELYVISVKGKKYAVLVGLLQNKLYEIFAYELLDSTELTKTHYVGKIVKIKKGQYSFITESFTLSNLELAMEDIEERATTLLTSMLLRHGVEINQIVKTLRKINPFVSSFTAAICRVLLKFEKVNTKTVDLCPQCEHPLRHTDGCLTCTNCDYSKCYLTYIH